MNDKTKHILPDKLYDSWDRYVRLWKELRRREAEKELRPFLDELKYCDDKIMDTFAFECCHWAFEIKETFPMQHPLLMEVILPYLYKGLWKPSMPEVLWIVEASKQGYTKFIWEVIGRVSEFQLLELALALEPNNKRAFQLLSSELVDSLDWCAHHMPDGYIEPNEEVNAVLNEMERLIENYPEAVSEGFKSFYYDHLKLFNAWLDYTSQKERESFREYCDSKGIDHHIVPYEYGF